MTSRRRRWALLTLLVTAASCQPSDSATTSGAGVAGPGPVRIAAGARAAEAIACVGVECCPAGFAVVEGTPGSELLAGGNGSQCIVGREGDDTLTGDNAPDRLDGGAGNDRCDGGRGDDVVLGGDGDDVLVGDNGVDLLRGGPGRDTMDGGRGDDAFVVASVCEAVPGERIEGGPGFDTLRTPLSAAELAELGVELVSIERLAPLAADDAPPECDIPDPADFGDLAGDPGDVLCRVLAQTAAVVRGRVTGITPSFDAVDGPRQIVELAAVETLLGLEQPNALRLRVLGGPLPGGDLIHASHVPRFQVGDDYVLFLFNRAWRFAPVPLDFYFRVREDDGHELLITETGHVLTGALGGRLIRQSFADVDSDPAQAVRQPISAAEMTRVASVAQYRADLEAVADSCPDGPTGVFTPFPVGPWDVAPLARDLPIQF